MAWRLGTFRIACSSQISFLRETAFSRRQRLCRQRSRQPTGLKEKANPGPPKENLRWN